MKRPKEWDFSGISNADKWGDYADALDKYIDHIEAENKESRTYAKVAWDSYEEVKPRFEALEAENNELKGYAKHKYSCDINYKFGDGECTCGLDKILNNK